MRKIIPVIVIGLVAAAVSVSSYFFTQNIYADTLCRQAAAQLGWRYVDLQPPDLIVSHRNRSAGNISRDARCIFSDGQGTKQSRSIQKLSGSFWKGTLVSLGLQIDLVFVIAAVCVALVWIGLAKLFSPGKVKIP